MASRETDAIVAKHRSSGVGGRVTSIASPAPDRAKKSFHAAEGTGGISTAVDLADDSGNVATPIKQAIFDLFLPDKAEIAELFYAFAPVYVKNGRAYPISRMNRAVWLNHRDHVHIAVRKGTFLKAASPAPVTQPQEEDDDMFNAARTITWPNGSKTCVTPEGDVQNFEGSGKMPPHFGGIGSFPAAKRTTFKEAVAITPRDITDPGKGYTIWNVKTPDGLNHRWDCTPEFLAEVTGKR